MSARLERVNWPRVLLWTAGIIITVSAGGRIIAWVLG